MDEFKKRSLLRRIIFSRFVFLALVVIAVALGFSVVKTYEINRAAETIKSKAENELLALEDKRKQFEASLGRLNSEFGVEEELRSKLQVKKPGEELVIIIEETNGGGEASSTEINQETGFFKDFFDKILRIFR